ncbi:MAG TPA: prepilin-type N-terminal cleavage/methylation domain-containing protein [Candidatus Binataceae bacterium]|nr:prepilin-type N-terminal cleavage/methylation domain-containing protein [Candidatus Binataceae bacterium]
MIELYPSRHSRQRLMADGFTLIEMMLAVAILAVILAMMASSFHAVAGSKIHAEGRMWADRAGRSILWELTSEIRGTVQTPAAPSHVMLHGVAQFLGGVAANTISLSTLDAGHRRSLAGFSSEDIVSYTLSPNPSHHGWLMLTRTQQSGLAYGGVQTMPILLADNVLSLRMRYFDGNQWGDTWNSDVLSPGEQIPIAVSINLDLAAPNGRDLRFSTQVMLPMSIAVW